RKRVSARWSRRRRIGACFDRTLSGGTGGACSDGKAERAETEVRLFDARGEDRSLLRLVPKGRRSGLASIRGRKVDDRGSLRSEAAGEGGGACPDARAAGTGSGASAPGWN